MSCNATFEANPDIAGLGVLIAFEVTAWLTILFALIPAAISLWASIRCWLSQPESGKTPLSRVSRLRTILRSRKLIRSWFSLSNQLLEEDPPWVIRLPRVTDAVMMPLCDLQIVTGISILAAGFVTLQEATFYHQQITLQLWWLTVNSFWVARVEVERRYASQHNVCGKSYALTLNSPVWNLMRKLAVLCSVALGFSYQSITQARQDRDWDPEVGGLCYRSKDHTWPWIWTAGTGVYALMLLLIIVPRSLSRVESIFGYLEGKQKKWNASCRKFWREKVLLDTQQPFATFESLSLSIAATARLVFFWLFMHFFTIWSYGSGWYPILILAEVGFAIWSTYDIVDLKNSNLNLVDGDENAWGFGQVLPMVLLSLIVFQAIDAWYRSRQTELKAFPSHIELLEYYEEVIGAPLGSISSHSMSVPPLAALRDSAIRRDWWAESERFKVGC